MTKEEHRVDDTDRDPDAIKRELFEAWMAVHPAGTRQEFDDGWAAMTSDTRPSDTRPSFFTGGPPPSEDRDPVVMKRRMFEEWVAHRPDGTREQFEAEWAAITSLRGA